MDEERNVLLRYSGEEIRHLEQELEALRPWDCGIDSDVGGRSAVSNYWRGSPCITEEHMRIATAAREVNNDCYEWIDTGVSAFTAWLNEQIRLAAQAELEPENFLPSKTLEEILEGE